MLLSLSYNRLKGSTSRFQHEKEIHCTEPGEAIRQCTTFHKASSPKPSTAFKQTSPLQSQPEEDNQSQEQQHQLWSHHKSPVPHSSSLFQSSGTAGPMLPVKAAHSARGKHVGRRLTPWSVVKISRPQGRYWAFLRKRQLSSPARERRNKAGREFSAVCNCSSRKAHFAKSINAALLQGLHYSHAKKGMFRAAEAAIWQVLLYLWVCSTLKQGPGLSGLSVLLKRGC